MPHRPRISWRRATAACVSALACAFAACGAHASDHLDTPTVIADPRADIGDLYAWTSADGKRLNLAMAIVGHTFSDKLAYTFHIDSGKRFGETTKTTTIVCTFPDARTTDCRVGNADRAHGDASGADGLQGRHHRFRVFAGLRDDPFFNNVKGTRAAYDAAKAAIQAGSAPADAAGCPNFDAATTQAILDQWRHTAGGPATNLLAGWTPASIVVSVDLGAVASGGKVLAIWSSTSLPGKQLDRAGRPLTGNALLGTISSEEESDRMKEDYNASAPADAARFAPEIRKSLGLYDGFDGKCGNQLLADRGATAPSRYDALAALLADDRLWVNAASGVCTQLFAVERAALAGETSLAGDCGGRTPNYDAVDVYRSLLATGTGSGIDDGVDRDELIHSDTVFPFFAAPATAAGYKP